MIYLKCISQRNSWCQLKRLQSSLSTTNSKISIPARIERRPTDILHALASTVPEDPIRYNYVYHDDPFFIPLKKVDYRNFALAYEAGRNTAKWIFEKHSNLFPEHLSEPKIKEFESPPNYDNESQVTEEILLQVISEFKDSKAVEIYHLLEKKISSETKQSLLELLCFCKDTDSLNKDVPFRRWFHKKSTIYSPWQYEKEIFELYEFLKNQDSVTAALAHSAMICGLTKAGYQNDAWKIFSQCKSEDISLDINAYNSALQLLPNVFKHKSAMSIDELYSILETMNKNGIKPNIDTINSAIKVVALIPSNASDKLIKYLLNQCRILKIPYSLRTYHYILLSFHSRYSNSQKDFEYIINVVADQTFTVQHCADFKFFPHAMSIANYYNDVEMAKKLHSTLLRGNRMFLSNHTSKYAYITSYLTLLLRTCTIDEFFTHYEKFVPHEYQPSTEFVKLLTDKLKLHEPKTIVKCIQKLWNGIFDLYVDNIEVKCSIIKLIDIETILSADSDVKSFFANAALDFWKNDIKIELAEFHKGYILENSILANLGVILLHTGYLKESIEILQCIVKSNKFLPTINETLLDKLFESCISTGCIKGALLALEYAVNSGFSDTDQMGTKLKSLPAFTNDDQNVLIKLLKN